MILPSVVVVLAAAIWLVFRYLARIPDGAPRWRAAVALGLVIGIIRAVLATAGWYVVEHTGGWLQIPAFVLVMFAWPEGVLFAGRRAVAGLAFFVVLELVLIVSTIAIVVLVAAVVTLTRGVSAGGIQDRSA